jgi:ankyrin repeat protein
MSLNMSLLHSPLHLASANGLVAVVHYLLSRNVNWLAQDSQGCVAALSCASSPSVAQCLYLILERMMPGLIPPIAIDLPNEEVEELEEEDEEELEELEGEQVDENPIMGTVGGQIAVNVIDESEA